MNFTKELKNEKEKLFHFYIISGDLKKNRESLESFLGEDLNFSFKNDDNFFHYKTNRLSIGESRDIKKKNYIKNNQNELRVFLIETGAIDGEAQNALLKVFEEPQRGTVFFLLLPEVDNILNTIKSRARILRGFEGDSFVEGIEFLKSSFLEREKKIKKMKKRAEDSKELRAAYLNLIKEIDLAILENREVFFKDNNFLKKYERFLRLKKEAGQRGSALNYIIIYLAIILPVLK